MNLSFGTNLKKLRRQRDITQEELAGALGISVQSISRYETNAAYPDIEMLPVIAAYFGVSVDYLLGVSPKARESRRGEYMTRFQGAKGAEAKLEVLNEWRTEFPDDWEAVCNAVAVLGGLPAEKRGLSAMRGITKNALKRCTDTYWHDRLIFTYLDAETDERTALGFIREYGSELDLSKLNLMTRYYTGRDERKNRILCQYWHQAAVCKVIDFMTVYGYGGGVREAIEGCELALDFLKRLSHNPDITKPDMWLHEKLMALLRLSNNHLFFDEEEAAYRALDRAVTLIENAAALPNGTRVSYGSPKFDTLSAVTQKTASLYGKRESLYSCDGLAITMKYENLPFEDEEIPIAPPVFYPSDFRAIIAAPRWRNFVRHKDDPEYKKYAERVKKAADIAEPKNAEYILTCGAVQNPRGGRLCAVKTEDRENLGLLYILAEDRGGGFGEALRQFGESVGAFGITAAEPVAAVDCEGNPVPVPEEAKTLFAKV